MPIAVLTLSGPEGSVTLDGESGIPKAILRNSRTGQVRGILCDPPPATQAAADAVGARAPDLEVAVQRHSGGRGLEALTLCGSSPHRRTVHSLYRSALAVEVVDD